MREWFARGGFLFLDDFHGDEELVTVKATLHRLLPDGFWEKLEPQHSLFHCLFDVKEFIQVVNDSIIACKAYGCEQWENGPSGAEPGFFAVSDAQGRMQVLLAYNTDLGDGLEWADDSEYPQAMAAYSFRVLANVALWSMTH